MHQSQYAPAPSFYDLQPHLQQHQQQQTMNQTNYYNSQSNHLAQPPTAALSSHQQLLQQQHSQRSGGIIGSNAHYSLVQHVGSSQPSSAQSSPFRLGQQNSPMTQQNNPTVTQMQHGPSADQAARIQQIQRLQQQYRDEQQQHQQQQQIHGAHMSPHLLPPHSLNGNRVSVQQQRAPPSFARELFPHEQSLKDPSPPPNTEEYSLHERNVRALTESPPPEQVANMLSSILSPDLGSKFAPQSSQMRNGGGMQAAQGPPQGMTTHQQQLYAHFLKSQPPQMGQPQQQQYQSTNQPNTYGRPMPAQSQQPSYYDQMSAGTGPGNNGHFGGQAGYTNNSQHHLHQPQQQQQQPHLNDFHSSPHDAYVHPPPPLQGRSQSLPEAYPHHSQGPPQQHHLPQPQGPYGGHMHVPGGQAPPSPSSIPGMASIVDPEYYAAMKARQLQQQMLEAQAQRQREEQQQRYIMEQKRHEQLMLQPQQQQSQQPPVHHPTLQHDRSPPPGLAAVSVTAPPGFNKGGPQPSQPPQTQSIQQQQMHGASADQSARIQQVQRLQQQYREEPSQPQQDNHLNRPQRDDRTQPSGSPQSAQVPGKVPPPPFPRRTQSLGDSNAMNPAPVSHEAVSVSLSRAGGRADLSRFSAGPPQQESRGFVARCCTEARRGRGSSSSVLSRTAGLGGRKASHENAAPSSAYIPLSNPYDFLQSSPSPEAGPGNSFQSQRPTTLQTQNPSPSVSNSSTPIGSPLRGPKPRIPLTNPVLPPK